MLLHDALFWVHVIINVRGQFFCLMSRLIVKGLPPYVSDARLREHFSQKGSVTDVKLMRRPDGTSRRFGFVGFRTEDEARSALEYFDRTYIDTARLSVAFARSIGDESLVKHKKKEREKPTEPRAEKPKGKGASFDEFLAVMAPKLKRKAPEPAPTEPQDTPKKKKTKEPKAKAEDEREPETAPSDGAAQDEELDDLAYMRRRMRYKVAGEAPPAFVQSDDEQEEEEEEEEEEEDPAEVAHRAKLAEEQRKDEENVDTIMESGRLFVRNLPFTATEDELESFFAAYGPVAQVRRMRQSMMILSIGTSDQ